MKRAPMIFLYLSRHNFLIKKNFSLCSITLLGVISNSKIKFNSILGGGWGGGLIQFQKCVFILCPWFCFACLFSWRGSNSYNFFFFPLVDFPHLPIQKWLKNSFTRNSWLISCLSNKRKSGCIWGIIIDHVFKECFTWCLNVDKNKECCTFWANT